MRIVGYRSYSYARVLAPAACALLVDQMSKRRVQQQFAGCDDGDGYTLAPHWVTLTYTCNPGAAFGLLPNQTLLFALIALTVIGAIVASMRVLPAGRPWLSLALGLPLGGALGNLLDRLRQGYVVDFIAVRSWPVFNTADICIVLGVLILAYYLLWSPSPSPPARE